MVSASKQGACPPPVTNEARAVRIAGTCSLVVLALAAVVMLGSFVSTSATRFCVNFPFAYGEGPIVRDAWLWSKGELFYRYLDQTPPYSLSNYTPVYYAIVGGLLHITGLSFIPGRLLSLVMGIGVLFFVYRIVSFYSRDKQSGLAASLVLFASPFAGNLLVNRVDATAAFFSVGAVTVLLTRPRTQAVALIAGTVAAFAALTRQTSFAFPLLVAGGVLIGERRWREFGAFLLALGIVAGGVSAAFEFASSGAYSFNVIISNINSLEWERVLLGLESVSRSFYAPLIAVVLVMFQRRDQLSLRPLYGILIVAASPALISIAKSGSNLNYLIEMYVALAIIFGIVVGSLSDRKAKALMLALVVAAIAAPHFESAKKNSNVLSAIASARAKATETVSFVQGLPGAVFTDDLMGIELLVGKEILFQPYEVNQLRRVGLWGDRGVRKLLRTGRLSALFIASPYRNVFIRQERWTQAQWRLLRRNYRTDSISFGSLIFIPNRQRMFKNRA